jgi:hypothetical protein
VLQLRKGFNFILGSAGTGKTNLARLSDLQFLDTRMFLVLASLDSLSNFEYMKNVWRNLATLSVRFNFAGGKSPDFRLGMKAETVISD